MPLGHWNLQWLNHNSQRSYPITDFATSEDTTQTIKIPDDFILGFYFPVHAGLNVQDEKFYIRQLTITSLGYSLVFAYDDGTATPPLIGSVNINKASHTEYTSYAVPGTDIFDDSVGKIVIGPLTSIDKLPVGTYSFTRDDAQLETDCIRPMIRGITSITVVNGSDSSERIYGDIELAAGNNMRITSAAVSGQPTQVIFSAIEGEGLNEECVCDDDDETAPCIRFINGIPPLSNGNFRMTGNKCMDLQPITNGIEINDICSEPCCGCEELTALTRQIDRFADGVVTIQGFVNRLNAEVTQMSLTVLGSRINDEGCITC